MTAARQEAQRTTEEAFRELVEGYSNLAHSVALRMLRNTQDAEDAVQEAFIYAYRAFSTFKGKSKVSTWLYRIVVNTCLMKLRKEKTRAKYLAETGYNDAIVRDWSSDPELTAMNGELHAEIETGLRRLSPELRAPVVLRDVHRLSSDESAGNLGISVPAFKSRLHRGRVLLRRHLEGFLAKPV